MGYTHRVVAHPSRRALRALLGVRSVVPHDAAMAGKTRIEDDEPPVGAVEFAALMRPFEPFEGRPRLAVAVSGGRDSLALALLAREWVRTRGGELVALVVDHAL